LRSNRQTILERAAGGIRDPEDAATKLEAAVKGVAEVKSSTGAPAVSPKGVNPYRFSVVAKACIRSPVECSTLEPESPRQPRSSRLDSVWTISRELLSWAHLGDATVSIVLSASLGAMKETVGRAAKPASVAGNALKLCASAAESAKSARGVCRGSASVYP
jgi:hypothetical protein